MLMLLVWLYYSITVAVPEAERIKGEILKLPLTLGGTSFIR